MRPTWAPRRARPLQADRAQGPDRLRRRHLRRPRLRSQRQSWPNCAPRCRPSRIWSCIAISARAMQRCRRWSPGPTWRRSWPATTMPIRRVRAAVAAVRPSAVDRLFQRHHRLAQAHRPRPWRHRDRGDWRSTVLHNDIGCSYERQQLGRALPLVQLHRLGDVELRRSPACSTARPAASSTATRAAPRTSPTGRCCGASLPSSASTFFGAGAAFFANCMKAGIDLAALRRSARRARARHHRLAAQPPKCSAGATRAASQQIGQRRRHLVVQHLRRHRLRRRVHRRQPRTAADARRDAMPPARLRRRSLE